MNQIITAIKRYPIWLIVILCLIFFSFAHSNFLTFGNLSNILLQTSVLGIIAIGMTFVMINANIDLSVGSVLALCAALVVGLQDYGIGVAVLASLVAGTTIGLFNGFVVAKLKINAFIVTLAAMIGVRGLVFVYTDERAVSGTNLAFSDFGRSSIGPIPTIVFIFLLLLIIGEFVLRKTPHGRNVYAVGGNYEAAKNSGVNVERHVIINFAIIGFLTAVAGILLASRMNSATPGLGTEYELMIITATVLGGIKIYGGYGSMLHTFGGVVTIGIINNGLNLLNVQTYYNMLIMGLVLIVVIYIDTRFKPVGR